MEEFKILTEKLKAILPNYYNVGLTPELVDDYDQFQSQVDNIRHQFLTKISTVATEYLKKYHAKDYPFDYLEFVCIEGFDKDTA